MLHQAANSARPGEEERLELIAEVLNAALAKLQAANDPADIEKAVNLLKTTAEIQKLIAEKDKVTEDTKVNLSKTTAEIEKMVVEKNKLAEDAKKVAVDASLAARQVRATQLSAIFAPLVPIASLLTVVATLLISNQQIHTSAQQALQKSEEDKAAREEASWNSFKTDLDKSSPDQLYSSATFVARLKAFYASGHHDAELGDIIKKLMLGVSSASAFKELWQIQIKSVNAGNFDSVLEVARAKKQAWDEVQTDCRQTPIPAGSLPEDLQWANLGACSPKYSNDDLRKAFTDPVALKSLLTLKASMLNTSGVQNFLSQKISDYLREAYNKDKGARELDLSNILFGWANLKDVDLSKADLNQTTFGSTILEGAILTPKIDTYQFGDSTWWDAEKVAPSMLPYLVYYSYPRGANALLPSGYSISREKYVTNVKKLCTSNMKICSNDYCIRYGTEPVPTSPECQPQNNTP